MEETMTTTTITIENFTDTNLTVSVKLSESHTEFTYADAKSGKNPGRGAIPFAPPGESKNLLVAYKANGNLIPCNVKVFKDNKTIEISKDANGHFIFTES